MEVEGRATRMRVVYADHEARSADSRSLVHARDERDEYYGGDSVTKVRGAARPADRYRKLANIREDGAEKHVRGPPRIIDSSRRVQLHACFCYPGG